MAKDDPTVADTENAVTSAELVRSFAKWREVSLAKPVKITTHGRVSHVLTGVRLHAQLAQSAMDATHLSADDRLTGLSEWLNESVILCDADETILYANHRARELLNLPQANTGMPLTEALPMLDGSVMQVQYRRTLQAREAVTAELPSPFRPDRWIHFQSIPLGERLVLMLRDITEEVERYRMADAKAAMLDAISLHPAVAYVRLTMRGMIDKTDKSFEEWIGLSEEKLHGVRLGDLVTRETRSKYRNLLDTVLEENRPLNADLDILPNMADPISVHCSLVPLHGAYGIEGATIILTRHPL